jgi:cell division septation protein DedD
MKRSDILKRCLERGIAEPTEIDAAYHVFYRYLLSALREGSAVGVPGFGVFATRTAGVKAARRIPIFELDPSLSERLNERFRGMSCIVTGTFRELAVPGGRLYKGPPVPRDEVIERESKKRLFDAFHGVTQREFSQAALAAQRSQQPQEEHTMPRLNLKDDEFETDSGPGENEKGGAPPTLREVGGGGGGVSPILWVIVGLIVVAVAVFALNYFKVIHLWGKKAATTELSESLPEPEGQTEEGAAMTEQPSEEAAVAPTTTAPGFASAPAVTPPSGSKPAKPSKPAPAVSMPPSGTGSYTVQVSSWMSRGKADEEAGKLSGAGMSAFVEEGAVDGTTWYRVRVGRYDSQSAAKEAAAQLQKMSETEVFVAKVGK